jgi:hypothetical protein
MAERDDDYDGNRGGLFKLHGAAAKSVNGGSILVNDANTPLPHESPR